MRAMTTTWLLLASLAATALASQEAPQRPTFKASTELVLIDTQVVAKDGSPIAGLKPDQFEVFIDGRRQPVVAAEFIRTDGAGAPPASPAAAVASPEQPGRTIVLAVDQASFPMSGQASAREAATRIINSVAPEDSLGMVVFPGPIAIAPTRDRSALKEAVPNISGKRVDLVTTRFNISASEASQLRSRDAMATRDVTSRECRLDATNPTCVQEVIQDAGRIADTLEQQAMLSVSGLHGVLDAMEALPGRKTLMLVSAGLPMRPGGTPDLNGQTTEIGRRAAAANVNLYVFYMNVHFLRAFSAEY